jgi:hypothetical protein
MADTAWNAHYRRPQAGGPSIFGNPITLSATMQVPLCRAGERCYLSSTFLRYKVGTTAFLFHLRTVIIQPHTILTMALAWANLETLRIQELSGNNVLNELQNVMNGSQYSWKSIHHRLQELNVEYSIYLEWNALSTIKREWDEHHVLNGVAIAKTEWRPSSYQALLISLKVFPIQAGLGAEGKSPLFATHHEIFSQFSRNPTCYRQPRHGFSFHKSRSLDRLQEMGATLLRSLLGGRELGG